MKIFPFLCVLALFAVSCSVTEQTTKVVSNHKYLSYEGRIDSSSSEAYEMYWSGTSVTLNFEGTEVKAELQDERGENYYNVILDDSLVNIIHPDSTKNWYTLADHLSEGKHQLKLFKRTEYDRGYTRFFGFDIHGEVLPKEEEKTRKIEFYGDSITAGYAVEDFTGQDRPDSIYTNNYASYARLTADHFNAQYQCICKSGIGITISWFPKVMPEIYDRLNPAEEESHWSFKEYQPDIVVVNLFQNDSWLTNRPEHEEFKSKFGNKKPTKTFIIEAYRSFISSLRDKYPNADIICILGSMDATKEGSVWPEYIKEAVAPLDDQKIYTHFIPYKGTPIHPLVDDQKVMANSLISFIEENIKW